MLAQAYNKHGCMDAAAVHHESEFYGMCNRRSLLSIESSDLAGSLEG
jgi:hypothetical protein